MVAPARTQRVTVVDIKHGRIRIPVGEKGIFPEDRSRIQVTINGIAITRVAWDPRHGQDRERSGVLYIGNRLRDLVRPNERLDVIQVNASHVSISSPHHDRRITISAGETSLLEATLDVATAATFGLLSSIPLIGPVVRELIGVAWPNVKLERIQRFAVELDRTISSIEDRVDAEFVRQEEFQGLVEDVLDRLVRRRSDQKVAQFASIVANSSTDGRPTSRVRERFIDYLDELHPVQLAALARLAGPNDAWMRGPEELTVGQVAQSRLNSALTGLAVEVLDLQELERRGLIRSLREQTTLLATADGTSAMVTDLGRAFLDFIGEPSAPHERGAPSAIQIRDLAGPPEAWHTMEAVAQIEGLRNGFRTSTPFVDGTLSVYVDGIAQVPDVLRSANGEFEFQWDVGDDDQVRATWREA